MQHDSHESFSTAVDELVCNFNTRALVNGVDDAAKLTALRALRSLGLSKEQIVACLHMLRGGGFTEENVQRAIGFVCTVYDALGTEGDSTVVSPNQSRARSRCSHLLNEQRKNRADRAS